MDKVPSNLLEAVSFFAVAENSHEFMMKLRWPDGRMQCPRCGSFDVSYLPNARVFKCYEKHEKNKFSLKVGTIFEDSPLGLDKWLPVMWMLTNCKNGVSSWEIHRAVGVTQKSAWFMLQRGRLAMQDRDHGGGKLCGEVEADETFIGGAARNMHTNKRAEKIHGRGPVGKAIVSAVLERGGKVRATVIPNRRKKSVQDHVRQNVEAGSTVYSDELKSYEGLNEFTHQVINHTEAYVNGQIHSNGLENFWSLLKRGIGGTYVSVEPFHLFRYVEEQAFRYNHRKDADDAERFVT